MTENRMKGELLSAIAKMADGNPGAATALGKLHQNYLLTDPEGDNPFTPIFWLDQIGIYGGDIWGLYKHICKQDIESMIWVLKAAMLGKLSKDELRAALIALRSGKQEKPLDVEAIVRSVRGDEQFYKEEPEETIPPGSRMNGIASYENVGKMAPDNANSNFTMGMLAGGYNKIDRKGGSASTPIFWLDELEIYDDDIYQLYKEICKKDLTAMTALLKAAHLGIYPAEMLREKIKVSYTMPVELNTEAILNMIIDRYPTFRREPYLPHERDN